MADFAVRMVGPVALTATAVTYYTVPAARTALIRDIEITADPGVTAWVTISIGVDAAGKQLFNRAVIPGNGFPVQWTGGIFLVSAEIIQAYTNAPGYVTLLICGAEST